MKLRIATEIIKNALISSVILYLSFNEIKNKIKEKKNDDKKIDDDDYDSDDFKKSFLEDDYLFKKTDFE